MPTLSACVITKNEADNISRCITSIQSIVKEIIVVDTGSTDDTVTIAKTLGAKIFHFAWNNDFSAPRNYALEQAIGEWIIFLDADEYVPANKVQNIPTILAKVHNNDKISAIACLMEHTNGFGGTLKCQDKTARIFRNSSSIRYVGRIHETILEDGLPCHALYFSKEILSIIHTGYNNSNFIDKLKRNITLLEKDLENDTNTYLSYHYLSHAYSLLGEREKAIKFAYKALEDTAVAQSMFAHKPYLNLIQNLQQTGKDRPAIIHPLLENCLQKFPHHPEVLECRGNYLYTKGYYTQALTILQQALTANENYQDINLANDFFEHITHVQETIASIHSKKNDSLQAINHYILSLKAFKYNAKAFAGLISLIRNQEAANIVFLLNSIYKTNNKDDVCFIVTRLSALKVLKVLAYYEKIWSEKFQPDVRTGMLPFLHNDFEKAFRFFSNSFVNTNDHQAELMSIVTLLLACKPAWLAMLNDQCNPSFRCIAENFLGVRTNILSAEDLPSYLELVSSFAYLSSVEPMQQLLQIGLTFPVKNAASDIAEVLENQHLYAEALALYTYQITQLEKEEIELKSVYCRAGYCCYKIKNYSQAIGYFNKAQEYGYDKPDIQEYLSWILQ